jgi:prepilin-type N-terminal cleavage/methylation domain-containing protein
MTHAHGGQQGFALIEALVASAILGIGLIGTTQLTLKTFQTASENRQQTVAQQLAHEAMMCLRTQAKSGTTLCPEQENLEVQGVRYFRDARHKPRGDGQLIDLVVSVQWQTPVRRISASTTPILSPSAGAQIEWHSSASALTGWVSVSSP